MPFFTAMHLLSKYTKYKQIEIILHILLSFCHFKILTFYLRKNAIFRAFYEREEVLLKNGLIFEISESSSQM